MIVLLFYFEQFIKVAYIRGEGVEVRRIYVIAYTRDVNWMTYLGGVGGICLGELHARANLAGFYSI